MSVAIVMPKSIIVNLSPIYVRVQTRYESKKRFILKYVIAYIRIAFEFLVHVSLSYTQRLFFFILLRS